MSNAAQVEPGAHLDIRYAGRPSTEIASGLMAFIRAAESQGRDSELVVALLQESTDLLTGRQPRGGGLTEEQARYLVESGDFDADELADTEHEIASDALAVDERRTRLGALTRTFSAAEVAALLHIDASRVRHRQSKGLLYGVLVAGKRRYPIWQFVDGRPLPHLAPIVSALPGDWHPAAVESFMVIAKSSLRAPALPASGGPASGGAAAASHPDRLSPVEWLHGGGDPRAVVDILDGFLQS